LYFIFSILINWLERVLISEFSLLSSFHSPSPLTFQSRASNSPSPDSANPSNNSKVVPSGGVLHIVLLGSDGEKMSVQRLFMLLRVYAKVWMKKKKKKKKNKKKNYLKK
jgi:hypothetical protein